MYKGLDNRKPNLPERILLSCGLKGKFNSTKLQAGRDIIQIYQSCLTSQSCIDTSIKT